MILRSKTFRRGLIQWLCKRNSKVVKTECLDYHGGTTRHPFQLKSGERERTDRKTFYLNLSLSVYKILGKLLSLKVYTVHNIT